MFFPHKASEKNSILALISVSFLISAFLAGTILASNPLAEAQGTTMGIVAIPYFPPADLSWNTVFKQADAYPGTIKYAIINPCSGPCAEPLSQDWQNIIQKLASRGIISLGYVYYTEESLASIDYFMKDPATKTDGIFFDGEGAAEDLAPFRQYSDYIHGMGGIVYINPGYNYPPVKKYLNEGVADVANIYEGSLSRTIQISVPADISPEKLSVIITNANKEKDMQKALSEVAAKGIGNVYVTSKSYIALPSYFAKEIQKASTTPVH